MAQTFDTHYNYDRPFRVVIRSADGEHSVMVYRRTTVGRNRRFRYEAAPVISTVTDDVRIGKSPETRMTLFSGGHGPAFDGNSILYRDRDAPRNCDCDRNSDRDDERGSDCSSDRDHDDSCDSENGRSYVFIGKNIIKFRARAPIVEFVSPVGNNDIPYAYAVDELGNSYLLIEDVVVAPRASRHEGEDIYDYYYRTHRITEVNESDEGRGALAIQAHCGIRHFWVGDSKSRMCYFPHPENDYDRLTTDPDANMYVTMVGTRTKRRIRKERYCTILRSFGSICGFSPLATYGRIDRP